jgi:hypothetical protein
MPSKAGKREGLAKITVQLWAPLLRQLNELAVDACLNRDAFLSVVLAHEAHMLVSELKGRQNSNRARSHIKRCLQDLNELEDVTGEQGLRQVTMALRPEAAEALTKACTQANVARDCFVNRVIYLLIAKSADLERMWNFRFDHHQYAILDEGWQLQALLLGPRLPAIRDLINEDPFYALRTALRRADPETEGALHAKPLGMPLEEKATKRGLAGFNAYLTDLAVPGTSTQKELKKALEEWTSTISDGAKPKIRGSK